VWFGRVLMLLGIANGGIGFSLASGGVAYSQTGMIVYAAFAGVAGLVLIGLVLHTTTRKGKPESEEYHLPHKG
jgi:predicted alpha/beta-hydrolase family hydrolase